MRPDHMPELATLIARALIGNEDEASVAADVTAFRQRFRTLHYVR
jgi:glycine hydroxymethyltransferase